MIKPFVVALVAALLPTHAATSAAHSLYIVEPESAASVEAIKSSPSIRWWAELGDALLVDASEAPAGVVSRLAVSSDESLYVGPRFHPNEIEEHAPSMRVIASTGIYTILAGTREGAKAPLASGEIEELSLFTTYASRTAPVSSKRESAVADAISGPRWYSTVRDLDRFRTRFTESAGRRSARDYIANELTELGLGVSIEPFYLGGVSGDNVIGELRGWARPDDVYIVQAHYDSISERPTTDAPGAEDNGSGTAGVIELARILAERRPAATVRFALYSGEEQGLLGSEAYAASLEARGELSRVKGVFNMDMIGFTADADLDVFLDTHGVGNELADLLVGASGASPGIRIVRSANFVGRSDHVPFLSRAIPSVLIIENDFSQYPAYHRSDDSIQYISQSMGAAALKLVGAALEEIAGPLADKPATSVVFPNGGEALLGGLAYEIDWSVNVEGEVTGFDVEASFDGGATFTVLASSLPATSRSYEWRLPASMIVASARVRVTARLANSLELVDMSDSSFRIEAGTERFIRKARFRKRDGGVLLLRGSFPWEAAAIEVDGVRLGATVFRPKHQDGDTAIAIEGRDSRMPDLVRRGVPVHIRVVDVRNGGFTEALVYTR